MCVRARKTNGFSTFSLFFTFEHFSFCTFALVRVLRGITNGFYHFQNACACFFMKSPAKLTKSQNACGCSAVGEPRLFCRTSPVFLTFFFLRCVHPQAGPKKVEPLFSCFFHFRNVAVVHTPLEILTKCCSGPKETPIFVFSVFAIFTKCACGPCGVKNSLFTKKHRNR